MILAATSFDMSVDDRVLAMASGEGVVIEESESEPAGHGASGSVHAGPGAVYYLVRSTSLGKTWWFQDKVLTGDGASTVQPPGLVAHC